MSPPSKKSGMPGSSVSEKPAASRKGVADATSRPAGASSATAGSTPASGSSRPAAAPPIGDEAVVGSGEFRSSADRRNGLVAGIRSFSVKRVRYSNVKGLGIFEGDINLGPVEKMEQSKAAADALPIASSVLASGRSPQAPNIQFAVAITGARYRWPGGLIPYEVEDPSIQATVDAAIAHWQERTSIRFVARTPANSASYPNYVSFQVGDGCFSAVGMQGGKQPISIGLGCGVGQAIHEIGHAAGLWHEQSREDRDQFVRIAWENIIPNMEHNFDQHINDGDDIGPYDYDSIMHYPGNAFSANGLPTMVALGGQPIGQRNGLSEHDVAAVLELYPGSAGKARHRYTSLLLELAAATRDQGYLVQRVGFYGWPIGILGTLPLFKLSDGEGKEIYTTSAQEAYDAISTKGFTASGIPCYVFTAATPGLVPLYRLENSTERDSLLTTSLVEAQDAARGGYTGQGVAGYVLTTYVSGSLPVYQLSKPA